MDVRESDFGNAGTSVRRHGVFMLWLVYEVSPHSNFVPFMTSVRRLDVAAGASGKRGAPGEGVVDAVR